MLADTMPTDWLEPEIVESLIRLVIATLAGMAIGLNRDLRDKPVGMRTLGLVSLGSALAVLSCTGYGSLHYEQDAVSRVIQGILTGVGFIGAGVILHDKGELKIYGLTTAATVWIAAALGVAAGLGAWLIIVAGSGIALALLVLGGPLERVLEQLILGRKPAANKQTDDD
jgi:putative Mg2+ transporter-C (MgtC) family protein